MDLGPYRVREPGQAPSGRRDRDQRGDRCRRCPPRRNGNRRHCRRGHRGRRRWPRSERAMGRRPGGRSRGRPGGRRRRYATSWVFIWISFAPASSRRSACCPGSRRTGRSRPGRRGWPAVRGPGRRPHFGPGVGVHDLDVRPGRSLHGDPDRRGSRGPRRRRRPDTSDPPAAGTPGRSGPRPRPRGRPLRRWSGSDRTRAWWMKAWSSSIQGAARIASMLVSRRPAPDARTTTGTHRAGRRRRGIRSRTQRNWVEPARAFAAGRTGRRCWRRCPLENTIHSRALRPGREHAGCSASRRAEPRRVVVFLGLVDHDGVEGLGSQRAVAGREGLQRRSGSGASGRPRCPGAAQLEQGEGALVSLEAEEPSGELRRGDGVSCRCTGTGSWSRSGRGPASSRRPWLALAVCWRHPHDDRVVGVLAGRRASRWRPRR